LAVDRAALELRHRPAATPAGGAGSRMTQVVPTPPGPASAWIEPPCRSAIRLQMASPSPVPW
jgi:hypothetical protein